MDRELLTLPAIELAGRIRKREVSAREVVEVHIARIEEVNYTFPALAALAVLATAALELRKRPARAASFFKGSPRSPTRAARSSVCS